MSTIAEIRARWAAASRGPWGWKGNLSSKSIELMARRGWGDVVMTFRRWGMGGAQPAFVVDGLIYDAARGKDGRSMLVAPQSWNAWDIRDIDHPDARFIAASWADVRDLLVRCDALEARLASLVEDEWAGWHFDPDHPEFEHFCGYCGARGNGGDDRAAPQHAPDCPIVKARAALAGEGGERR